MINITRTDGKNPWDADEALWDKSFGGMIPTKYGRSWG